MKLFSPITSCIVSSLAVIANSAPTAPNTDATSIVLAERQQSFNGPPGYFNFVGVNGNNQWVMIPMDSDVHNMQNEAAQIVVKAVTSSNINAICIVNLESGKDLIFMGRQTIQVASPAKVKKALCFIVTRP